MKLKLPAAVFFGVAAMFAFAASAGAVDGTIEINQAKVMAAGGFPFKVTASGSYRLTGNLTVSSTTADAIDVNASNVTIDLNGFSVVGPGGTNSGNGIQQLSGFGLTVENGLISGFGGGNGVFTLVDGIVKNVQANTNLSGIGGQDGSIISGNTANGNGPGAGGDIACSSNCMISGNTANNSLNGITCENSGCRISNNTANSNTNIGILCHGSGCLISGNIVDNDGIGINAHDSTTGYGGNVLNGNTTSIFGGTSLGAKNTNLCNGSAC